MRRIGDLVTKNGVFADEVDERIKQVHSSLGLRGGYHISLPIIERDRPLRSRAKNEHIKMHDVLQSWHFGVADSELA